MRQRQGDQSHVRSGPRTKMQMHPHQTLRMKNKSSDANETPETDEDAVVPTRLNQRVTNTMDSMVLIKKETGNVTKTRDEGNIESGL